MPYLTDQRKMHLLDGGCLVTAGDLTYMLTEAVLTSDPCDLQGNLNEQVERFLKEKGDPRFADFAAVLGSLDATKREFRRRTERHTRNNIKIACLMEYADKFYRDTVAPYEDKKIAQNGDVY